MNNMFQLNSMMKAPKFNSYQSMMNFDFPPIMEPSTLNKIQMRQNMGRPDAVPNLDLRKPHQTFDYESDNSNEESKGPQNREDDLFLHPYSSMFPNKNQVSKIIRTNYQRNFSPFFLNNLYLFWFIIKLGLG